MKNLLTDKKGMFDLSHATKIDYSGQLLKNKNNIVERVRLDGVYKKVVEKKYIKPPKKDYVRNINRKGLIDKIKHYRMLSVKSNQESFVPANKVYIYSDEELETLISEVNKISEENKNEDKKENKRRKLMNIILGISESDLIEVARTL